MRWRVLLVMVAMAGVAARPASAEDGPVCADCHDEAAASMTHNIHMRIEPFEVQGRTVGCEACHGDGTQHMEEGDAALIRTFSDKSLEDGAVCSTCHTTKSHSEWAASTHAAEGMTCLDCHGTHTPNKPLEACKDCHADTMAEMQLPSHHPVREGKMTCVSCHDPHAATEAQLRTEHLRPNDLCFSCHMDKEGPFIFEHEPVVEDCRICHTPHGSVANNLLTANEPMLCLQCHEIHFHAGLKSPEGPIEIGPREIENPQGMYSMNATFTTRCSQCHSQVHGSDLPSNSLAGG
ncbi:MAG: DmsE family decaheme c-type cytochrome, partial [bacterium]|nr:DmsE family decaheme c-type cytochrome [bacterium]